MRAPSREINYKNHTIKLSLEDFDEYGIEYSIVMQEPVTDYRGVQVTSVAIDIDIAMDIYHNRCSDEIIEKVMKDAFDSLFTAPEVFEHVAFYNNEEW